MEVALVSLYSDDEKLLAYLEAFAMGRDNAVTSAEIKRDTGISPRTQRKLINLLVEQGEPVLSVSESKPGYYVATSWDDAQDGIRHLGSRAAKLWRRKEKVELALLDKFGRQERLDLESQAS